MKRLVIVGAGGYGREMYFAAKRALGYGTEWEIAGFLDDNLAALDAYKNYPPILGKVEEYEIAADDVFITAFGSLKSRRACVEALEKRGAKFISIIDRDAFIGGDVKIGDGVFIAHGAVLTAAISIGNHSCIFHNTTVGHDTQIGEFSHIYAQCAIGGNVHIGSGTSIYPGATIVPRRNIGDNAVVGINSSVIVDVLPGTTVFGSPAMELK